jgi:hypothetical protein
VANAASSVASSAAAWAAGFSGIAAPNPAAEQQHAEESPQESPQEPEDEFNPQISKGVKTLSVVETTTLDLAFLMDCTGSMGDHITFCKDKVEEIVLKVKEKFHGAIVRVAFVGYRDFDTPLENYPVLPFTEKPEELKSFLGTVEADGGDDAAEDLAAGLKSLNALEWKKGGARLAVLFTDAPAHGKDYHDFNTDDEGWDNHSVIKPEQRLEPYMKQLSRRQIDFHMFHLDESTTKMEGVLSAAYHSTGLARSPFVLHPDLKADPVALVNKLVAAATASLDMSKQKTTAKPQPQ